MTKTILVTGKWEGSVEIADPLTIPQVQLIENGLTPPEAGADGKVWTSSIDANKLPAVLGCVTAWNLKDFPEKVTAENFPASPRKASHALIDFIFSELIHVYMGEVEVPNE